MTWLHQSVIRSSTEVCMLVGLMNFTNLVYSVLLTLWSVLSSLEIHSNFFTSSENEDSVSPYDLILGVLKYFKSAIYIFDQLFFAYWDRKKKNSSAIYNFFCSLSIIFSYLQGDHVTFLNIYKGFLQSCKSSHWCHKNFINYHAMVHNLIWML